jgi:transposase
VKSPLRREPDVLGDLFYLEITTIGIDLAKTVFPVHALDEDGATVVRKRLRRAEVLSFVSGLEPCLIGMKACATSHHWARELTKFGTP